MESAEWQRLSQFVSDTRESLVRAAPPIPGSPSLEQTTDEILSTLSDLTLGISWTVGAVREVACRLATTMHLPVDTERVDGHHIGATTSWPAWSCPGVPHETGSSCLTGSLIAHPDASLDGGRLSVRSAQLAQSIGQGVSSTFVDGVVPTPWSLSVSLSRK
jgi:hypothetical protein